MVTVVHILGLYNICLHMWNDVSLYTDSFLHQLGQNLRNFTVTVVQERHGGPNGMYDYIEEGEDITLVPSVSQIVLRPRFQMRYYLLY